MIQKQQQEWDEEDSRSGQDSPAESEGSSDERRGGRDDEGSAGRSPGPSSAHASAPKQEQEQEQDGGRLAASSDAHSTRQKELKKPIATFVLMGIEYCGRVFLIPFVLFYTNLLMLDKSMAELGVAFDVS
jgi:hypothetical protein